MSGSPLEPYGIFCILEHSKVPFLIEIGTSRTISELKDRIFEKNKNKLKEVDADDLKLYQIDIVDVPRGKIKEEVEKKIQELGKDGDLDPRSTLSQAYHSGIPTNAIHIAARPPPRTEKGLFGDAVSFPLTEVDNPTTTTTGQPETLFNGVSVPLQLSPPQSQEDFKNIIDEFLNEIRPKIRELLQNADCVSSLLPSWKPVFNDKGITEHISKLQIPTTLGGDPSLLLHDLGESDDFEKYIPEVFSFGFHQVLINTSGSGKTRLLLEGLCRRWGFYIVAKLDTFSIGSTDLLTVTNDLDQANDYKKAKEMKASNTNFQNAVDHMRKSAEKRLVQLLLARFILLNLLVQEARVCGGLKLKEHRRLWVLLQVQPSIVTKEYDIFTRLTQLLRYGDTAQLKKMIEEYHSKIFHLLQEPVFNSRILQNDTPPLYCILDEAQTTTSQRLDEFTSEDYQTNRPFLREILDVWGNMFKIDQMLLVLSGTGISLTPLEQTLASSALKGAPYEIVNDIGAFDNPDVQARYIERYVPKDKFNKNQWDAFLTRAWAWLHGRYRSTAALLPIMMATGYQSPHRTITLYIERATGFRPTDGEEWANLEPALPPVINARIIKFGFDKMNPRQLELLCDVICDHVFYGRHSILKLFNCDQQWSFVQYGFARHKPRDTVIDEPLPIAAGMQWISQNHRLLMFRRLSRDILKHENHKNGFEAYIAYYMQKAFEDAPELDTIFSFRSDFSRWKEMHEAFELVVVTKERNKPNIFVATPSSGPSSNLGFLANTNEEVLDWMSTNKNQAVFCFPSNSFGPDLLFFIRSKISQKLLLVMIQAKKYDQVDKDTLIEGIRTVTPSWLWKSKSRKNEEADEAALIDGVNETLPSETEDILKNIPHGLKTSDAEYPVLRVFASWPGEAKLERSLEWKGEQKKAAKKGKNAKKNSNKARMPQEDSGLDNIEDPDRHPLAALHLANFTEESDNLGQKWFLGEAVTNVVERRKRKLEAQDPTSLPSPKRTRVGGKTE